MSASLQDMLALLPAGADPFDALTSFFIEQVYPTNIPYDRGVTDITACCALIVAIVLVSFALRLRSTGINWILRDSAMTRLDIKTWAPTLFACYAGFVIILLQAERRCSRNHQWTAFVGAWQYISLVPLIVCAFLLWINIVAQAPMVRNALLGAGSLERRGPTGIVILAGTALFLILASIGALLPPTLLLAKQTPRQTTVVNEILSVIAAAKEAGDLTLLQPLEKLTGDLEHVGNELKRGIRWAGIVCSTMLCLILTGAFFYVILLKSVKRKIARLERSLQETEETRQKMTTMSARREEMKREFAQYGADRPFANLALTADMPERYAIVLDSQLIETASKIMRLKEILRADTIHHLLYLSMILIYLSEALFQATGGGDSVESNKLLPLLEGYNAASFLTCAIPSVTLHLLDSWKGYRKHRSSASQHNRRRTIGDLSENVFNIPLHISKRQSIMDAGTGGIQVLQETHCGGGRGRY